MIFLHLFFNLDTFPNIIWEPTIAIFYWSLLTSVDMPSHHQPKKKIILVFWLHELYLFNINLSDPLKLWWIILVEPGIPICRILQRLSPLFLYPCPLPWNFAVPSHPESRLSPMSALVNETLANMMPTEAWKMLWCWASSCSYSSVTTAKAHLG